MKNNSIFAIRDVPRKGMGLVAIKKIPKGTRILSERSIINIDTQLSDEQLRASIFQQLRSLSEYQRHPFLSMHDKNRYMNAAVLSLDILYTEVQSREGLTVFRGVFPETSRINHACDNNLQTAWNERTQCQTVHAMRDISEGEEITISYLEPLLDRKTRQSSLLDRFRFTCTCSLCSLAPEQSQESDRGLKEMRILDRVIEQLIKGKEIFVSPLRTLRYCDRLIRLYTEQGREDVGFARALNYAAKLFIANGDWQRGCILAGRAAFVWKMLLGADSMPAIINAVLSQELPRYDLYGILVNWGPKTNEASRLFESNEKFERWLWRRE